MSGFRLRTSGGFVPDVSTFPQTFSHFPRRLGTRLQTSRRFPRHFAFHTDVSGCRDLVRRRLGDLSQTSPEIAPKPNLTNPRPTDCHVTYRLHTDVWECRDLVPRRLGSATSRAVFIQTSGGVTQTSGEFSRMFAKKPIHIITCHGVHTPSFTFPDVCHIPQTTS